MIVNVAMTTLLLLLLQSASVALQINAGSASDFVSFF